MDRVTVNAETGGIFVAHQHFFFNPVFLGQQAGDFLRDRHTVRAIHTVVKAVQCNIPVQAKIQLVFRKKIFQMCIRDRSTITLIAALVSPVCLASSALEQGLIRRLSIIILLFCNFIPLALKELCSIYPSS